MIYYCLLAVQVFKVIDYRSSIRFLERRKKKTRCVLTNYSECMPLPCIYQLIIASLDSRSYQQLSGSMSDLLTSSIQCGIIVKLEDSIFHLCNFCRLVHLVTRQIFRLVIVESRKNLIEGGGRGRGVMIRHYFIFFRKMYL